MVRQVVMGLCFLVLGLGERVVWRRIDLRQRDRCRVLGRLLRFGKLPNVLRVLGSRASGFLPNRLNQRRTQLDTSARLLLLVI